MKTIITVTWVSVYPEDTPSVAYMLGATYSGVTAEITGVTTENMP